MDELLGLGIFLTLIIVVPFVICLVRLCLAAKRVKERPESVDRKEMDHKIILVCITSVFLICWIAVVVVAIMIANGAISLM